MRSDELQHIDPRVTCPACQVDMSRATQAYTQRLVAITDQHMAESGSIPALYPSSDPTMGGE